MPASTRNGGRRTAYRLVRRAPGAAMDFSRRNRTLVVISLVALAALGTLLVLSNRD